MNMNPQIREMIRHQMKRRNLSQEALGELVEMSQPNIARSLSGRSGSIPSTWARILDELGLELVAVPKGTDVNKLLEAERR
jgi:predicted transcriptional regulator